MIGVTIAFNDSTSIELSKNVVNLSKYVVIRMRIG